MKAVVIHGPKDLRIEDRMASGPGPGEVLVEVSAGGICGSDLHYYRDGGFGPVRLREPMVLGHEVAGRIAAIGERVPWLSEGQQVAVSPSRPCHSCRLCRDGRPNQCLNMRFYGSAMPYPHIQGAFRQFLVADATQCADASGLSPGEAAMAEPLAVCLHAVGKAGSLLGKTVLVTGCGPIGILTILCAKRAGAETVVATDLAGFALNMANTVGADRTIDVGPEADELATYVEGEAGFDVAFECSGAESALRTAISCLRPGGLLVQLGLGGDMAMPMMVLTTKELRIQGSFRFHDEFFTAAALMRRRLVDLRPLITATLPLERAVEAFELASDRSRSMKVQLEFTS